MGKSLNECLGISKLYSVLPFVTGKKVRGYWKPKLSLTSILAFKSLYPKKSEKVMESLGHHRTSMSLQQLLGAGYQSYLQIFSIFWKQGWPIFSYISNYSILLHSTPNKMQIDQNFHGDKSPVVLPPLPQLLFCVTISDLGDQPLQSQVDQVYLFKIKQLYSSWSYVSAQRFNSVASWRFLSG